MVLQQRDDRTATRTDGVGITRGLNAVAARQSQQDSFLRDKGLNRIGALNLGRQIDLTQRDAVDGDRRHAEENLFKEFGFVRIKTGLTLTQVPCEDCATGLTNCPILVFPEL